MPTTLKADFVQNEAPGLDWGNGVANALNRYTHGVYNVREYGAVGDGTTDDGEALQDAIDAWIAAGSGAVLLVPPGTYRYTTALLANFTTTNRGSSIQAWGAMLAPDFDSGHGIEFRRTGDAVYVSHLIINGLQVDGEDHTDTTSALVYFNGDDDNLGAIFRTSLRDLTCTNWAGSGLKIEGSVFEVGLHNPDIQATNTTGYGLHMLNAGTGNVSSIDIFGGTMDGGLRNIYSPDGDAKVFGGTYLRAYNEAIRFDAALEGGLWGVHVEQAWRGGADDPDWSLDQAGVRITGRAYCFNVYGTANDKMRCVLRTFTGASSKSVIIGGVATGAVGTYLRALGASTSTTVAIGVPDISNGITSGGVLQEVG